LRQLGRGEGLAACWSEMLQCRAEAWLTAQPPVLPRRKCLRENDVVPYFKTEPGLPQIHLEGNRLVLTCLAEGSWPLEFKWMHNDSELTTYTSEYK
ncbi:hypothetical protein EI555_002481, partial [Monodon monoceros]